MSQPAAAVRLTLLTRAECELCELFLLDLDLLRARVKLPAVDVVDIDSDPVLLRRWGLKVPVLLLAGALVCEGQLDVPELLRLLRL